MFLKGKSCHHFDVKISVDRETESAVRRNQESPADARLHKKDIKGRLGRESLNASSQARDLPRCRIALKYALRGGALDFRLCKLQGFGSDGNVTGSNRFFDLADKTADARTASLVDCGTAGDRAGRLFRRSCVGHVCLSTNSNQTPPPPRRSSATLPSAIREQ